MTKASEGAQMKRVGTGAAGCRRCAHRRIVGAALAGILLSLMGCEGKTESPPSPIQVDGDVVSMAPELASWSYVQFAQAVKGPALAAVSVPARVAVDEARSSTIVAPLAGRVESLAVRLGQRVSTGDHLLSIRSPGIVDLQREVELRRARESASLKIVERVRDLVHLKASPEKDLIAAEQELNQARLSRESAESKLRTLSIERAGEGVYWIKAPRDGVVVERAALVGQEAGPNRTEPLLEIAELDEVIVKADVPEADVVDLHVGVRATVTSAAVQDRTFPGRVEHVGLVVDPERRMVDVRVRVPNLDSQLRPNAFVQVEFVPDAHERILVDAHAVVTDDQQAYVFVQPAGQATRLERRRVQTGRRRADKVEILDGLQAGDTYVAKGAILLLNAMDLAE